MLDDFKRAAAATEKYPGGAGNGEVQEYKGIMPHSQKGEKSTDSRGGLSVNCGCAVCPCR